MNKGVKALQEICGYYYQSPQYKIIEKELNALEIIKNKSVCIKWLRNGLVAYNNTCALHDLPRLAEEEFNLLREVFYE